MSEITFENVTVAVFNKANEVPPGYKLKENFQNRHLRSAIEVVKDAGIPDQAVALCKEVRDGFGIDRDNLFSLWLFEEMLTDEMKQNFNIELTGFYNSWASV